MHRPVVQGFHLILIHIFIDDPGQKAAEQRSKLPASVSTVIQNASFHTKHLNKFSCFLTGHVQNRPDKLLCQLLKAGQIYQGILLIQPECPKIIHFDPGKQILQTLFPDDPAISPRGIQQWILQQIQADGHIIKIMLDPDQFLRIKMDSLFTEITVYFFPSRFQFFFSIDEQTTGNLVCQKLLRQRDRGCKDILFSAPLLLDPFP